MRTVSFISSGTISATRGYCTLTATTRPSWRTARWTWASDAADAESASNVGEQLLDRAHVLLDHPAHHRRRCRRDAVLQLRQLGDVGLGQEVGTGGHELAELEEAAPKVHGRAVEVARAPAMTRLEVAVRALPGAGRPGSLSRP